MSGGGGGGGEIRLSIVGRGVPARKYPPPPQRNNKPVVQMARRIQPVSSRRKQSDVDDEEGDDDDVVVDDDNDHQSHIIVQKKRQSAVVYKNFRDTFSCFSLSVFVWLCLLTLFIVYHLVFAAATSTSRGAAAAALVPVIEAKKDHTRWDVPFTIVPDEGSSGRLMTLPLKQLVFDRLVRYDVCCFQQSYFVCRAATKNIGVECLIAKDRGALINVVHPDMVGARCVLMWSEKN